jgi:putative membrane protein
MILTLYMSRYVEHVHLTTPLDPQVYTHLLSHVEGLTAVVSACERLLRTPIPLGYNIAISRIVWIFIIALPSQLWRELKWWSISVTMLTAYALFALAEVGLEIENVCAPLPSSFGHLYCRHPLLSIKLTKPSSLKPWGEGPNDLDLDRYCNLLALDLEEIISFKPQHCWFSLPKSVFATPGATTPTLDIKNSFLAVGAEHEEPVNRRLLL